MASGVYEKQHNEMMSAFGEYPRCFISSFSWLWNEALIAAQCLAETMREANRIAAIEAEQKRMLDEQHARDEEEWLEARMTARVKRRFSRSSTLISCVVTSPRESAMAIPQIDPRDMPICELYGALVLA